MYQHILIPTDGSPLATVATEKAIAFARDAGAKVTVVAVVEPCRVTFSAEASQLRAEYDQRAREEVAGWLTDAQMRARAQGVPCDIIRLEGDQPYRMIIETAAKLGCDLIAMASHGLSGGSPVVLGSETVKVLTHSTLPVLVYR